MKYFFSGIVCIMRLIERFSKETTKTVLNAIFTLLRSQNESNLLITD